MPRFLRRLSRFMETAPVISGLAELCALLFPCVAAFHCFSQQRDWSGIYAHRYCATQDNIAAPLCEKNWLSWQDPNIINGTIAGCLVCATLSKVPDANESIDMVFHIFLDILFPAIRVGLYVLILGRFAFRLQTQSAILFNYDDYGRPTTRLPPTKRIIKTRPCPAGRTSTSRPKPKLGLGQAQGFAKRTTFVTSGFSHKICLVPCSMFILWSGRFLPRPLGNAQRREPPREMGWGRVCEYSSSFNSRLQSGINLVKKMWLCSLFSLECFE